jgi:radical SAM superfamily enzyme YgiQ (UPF0313 family)
VHDRIVLEIMRGCTHLCKFCEAGSTCLPRRERSREKIVELAGSVYAHTGYEEISLISLSSGGHSGIKEILRELQTLFKDRAVSISMPSLRIEEITDELPQLIGEVRKTGLTFAPETGSERLRKFIHKDIDIEKLLSAALEAYKAGWDRIKLYFMIGLPTEEEEDLLATAELIRNLSNLRKQFGKGAGYIVASVATFVPKPHTCLQWVGMEPREALEAKQRFLEARSGRTRKVKLDFHDLDTSRLEGVFSRGDRRLGGVIEKAWKMGSRLDSWSEFFRIEVWLQAFRECGLAPEFYVNRARSHEELLPWDFIDVGISKAQLMAFSKS